ncbi:MULTISPECIES: peroxidase-related enzyme [unclassified Brenneria]|uniref:peroxidase-related enzyme n=1 Tax=unclassified Brenneria TaxID=2634434 RepID=UPI0029C3F7FE|nr:MULTISPECIES: peroxidase-related enzyme [unclassified Brenneria]MDX5630918.1 peroxidase-related enzyme [Brenneria sp. L3-3Z]MDX5698000.1 peroxidase-related enzyme [Brenneria sp. L4-2C]
MSSKNVKTKDISWLKLKNTAPTEETEKLFSASLEARGFIRNMQAVLGQFPAALLAQDALSRALTVEYEGGLSGKERELIALVVSVQNRCRPCVWGHAAKLRQITGDPLWVGGIEVNYRDAELTVRERAIADYVQKLTEAPEAVVERDLEPLRASGVTEREIIEVVAIAAYFNFSNRVNSGLGIHPNPEPFLSFR